MDFEALLKLIEIQKLAGVAALTVCGTTGESVTMTARERRDVIAFCAEHKGPMKLIAGAGTNDTAARRRRSAPPPTPGPTPSSP